MKKIINFIAIILVVMLQITIVPRLDIYYAVFNLPLLIMLSLILIKRYDLAVFWLLSGVLLDLISPIKFGFYTFSYLFIYLLATFVVTKFFHQINLFIIIFFFVICSFVIDFAFLFYDFQIKLLLLNAIYNTFIGYIIYYFLKYYLEPQSIIKVKI